MAKTSPPREAYTETRLVTVEELRARFNASGYAQRITSGNGLHERFRRNVPVGAAHHQPTGTRSQLVDYVDDGGRSVALVHQYRLADGSIGASGLPDPKWLVLDGVLYRLHEDLQT